MGTGLQHPQLLFELFGTPYAKMVWPRVTKFRVMTHRLRVCFVSSHASHFNRTGSQHPQIFLGPLMYAQIDWPRMMKFGVLTHGEVACFCGSAYPKGTGPQGPKSFWNPYLRPNGLAQSDEIWYDNVGPPTCGHVVRETATKFYMVIKLWCEKNFCRVDQEYWSRSVCDS